MKISTKGRYGLRILLDIAMNPGEQPRMIRDICKSQKISEKYAGRLIIELRKAGMLVSIRGAHGGFKLKKMPKDISLLEVIETMEGPVSVVDCVGNPKNCKRVDECGANKVWSGLNSLVKNYLADISLQDIIDSGEPMDIDYYCI